MDLPVVIGVDPSLTACGLALLEFGESPIARIVRTGPADGDDPARIATMLDALDELIAGIEGETPLAVAIETQFGAWGDTPAQIRARAAAAGRIAALRGAVTAWAQRLGARVVEVSPAEAKRALVGHGQAAKGQMVAAVRARYGLHVGQDAADAIGIALAAQGQLAHERALARETAWVRTEGRLF